MLIQTFVIRTVRSGASAFGLPCSSAIWGIHRPRNPIQNRPRNPIGEEHGNGGDDGGAGVDDDGGVDDGRLARELLKLPGGAGALPDQ
eukprot:COSAG02_NODE_2675_length_8272_cov_3.246391_5_plen_88_part_00